MIKKAYKFRFYPTAGQERQLAHTFGCVRFVYNWALDSGRTPGTTSKNALAITKVLLALKKNPEYQRNLLRYPTNTSAPANTSGMAKDIQEETRCSKCRIHPLCIQVGQRSVDTGKAPGTVEHWSRDIPDKPTTVTVSKDCAGRYFVSLLCDADVGKLPVSPNIVGIDLGIKDAVVTSDGWKSGNPRYIYKNQAKPIPSKVRYARVHAKIGELFPTIYWPKTGRGRFSLQGRLVWSNAG